jgi:chromosome segregation ATPase
MNQTALVEQLRQTPDLIGEIIKVVKRNTELEKGIKLAKSLASLDRGITANSVKQLRDIRNGMQSLKNEYDKAVAELETAKADCDAARALHRDLKFDYDRVTETLDAVRSDRDVYASAFREGRTSRAELEQAKQTLKEHEAKYERAMASISAYQKAEARLRERLVEQATTLDKLRNQVKLSAPSESEWKAKEVKLAGYEEQIRQLQDTISTLEGRIETFRTDNGGLRLDLMKAKAAVSQLKVELGKKNATLDQASSNALSNAEKRNDTADELVNLKLVNAGLREENRERANDIIKRDYENRGLKAKSEHDEATIAKLKAKLEKTKTELAKRSDPDEYESSLVDELIVLRVANGELKAKLAKIEEVGTHFLQLL